MANKKYGSTAGFGMELKGFDGLETVLKELPIRTEKRVLERATIAALRPTRTTLRANAPRGEGERSKPSQTYGRLFQNIKLFGLKSLRRGGSKQRGARISTTKAFWGFFGEIGTRKQAANPWFAPTFRQEGKAILERLAAALRIGIEKELRTIKPGSAAAMRDE